MSQKLKQYALPEKPKERIRHIITLLDAKRFIEAEKETAKFALMGIDSISSGGLTPEDLDNFFTLLNLYIENNFSEIEFSDEYVDLVFEGMLLHDLNTKFGADVSLMKKLAEKILNN